jgi:alpha-D-ribose 1-methylphosphonate 5-triphosphate diphosphatase PhnM
MQIMQADGEGNHLLSGWPGLVTLSTDKFDFLMAHPKVGEEVFWV